MIVMDHLKSLGVDTSLIQRVKRTAVYCAMFDNSGELVASVADMSLLETPFEPWAPVVDPSAISMIVMDANLDYQSMRKLVDYASSLQIPILFEPTSRSKCGRIFMVAYEKVGLVTPDLTEARTMAGFITHQHREKMDAIRDMKIDLKRLDVIDLEMEVDWMKALLYCFPNVILKMGSRGCLVGTSRGGSRKCNEDGKVSSSTRMITHLKPTRDVDVVNVSGAGDSLVGVVVSALSQREFPSFLPHEDLCTIVEAGMKAAEFTVETEGISSRISKDLWA
jgi:sugar/nucleoside kinase (ribokinase family)